ncbi:MAG: glycosyltransferase family 2 protein [Acidimicrobiales bacterium]|nr:glycosyltransferase family 2 protein [Acidimicrobiales bacterium]
MGPVTSSAEHASGSLDERSICAVLPAYNEAENLDEVIEELATVLAGRFAHWRIMIADDGSTDETVQVMARLTAESPSVSHLRLRQNGGKSQALRTALDGLDADLVLLMDADGQDDPGELYALLGALDAGADLVTGRREIRNDRFVKRNTSKLYNAATARMTGVEGRDFNSGYKLMTGEVAASLNLYGELHRYIPVLASWEGFKVAEVDVNHRPRAHGSSKFGRNRFWRGMLDLFTVKFITTYSRRPFHLIGGAGLSVGLIGGVLLAWMLIERIAGNEVGNRPALLAGITLTVVGVQLVSVGLLAELIVLLDNRRRRMRRSTDEGGFRDR